MVEFARQAQYESVLVNLEQLTPSTREALEEGRAQFNQGRYFEAHEVWEQAWRREKGELRACLQGLIQLAAGYFKALTQRNANGAEKLLEMSLATLEPFPDVALGLALGALRERAASDLGLVRAWARGEGDALASSSPPALERTPP